jgi:hypothetical protein
MPESEKPEWVRGVSGIGPPRKAYFEATDNDGNLIE